MPSSYYLAAGPIVAWRAEIPEGTDARVGKQDLTTGDGRGRGRQGGKME